MHRLLHLVSALALIVGLWAGCSATPNTFQGSGSGGNGAAGGGGSVTITTGMGAGGATSYAAHLSGKVVAPEGTIPISGALVYVTSTPPPSIPDGVYCDQCVHLDASIAYTTTKPDGTFVLGTNAVGDGYFVVQKGAFRRVRQLKVVAGMQAIPPSMTTMPPKSDKAKGDDVPKIAVVLGAWDPIEVVLARLGLEAKITTDAFGKAQVLSADATGFAVYGLHGFGETSPYPTPQTLLTTPSEMEKYHMVFLPCTGSADLSMSPQCSGEYLYDPKVVSTLEGFVKKGGKVYASDWAYEYVRQVFPGFVSWAGETSTIGSACNGGGGTQSAPPSTPTSPRGSPRRASRSPT